MTVKNADEAAALHKIKQNDEVKEYLPKVNPQKKGRQYNKQLPRCFRDKITREKHNKNYLRMLKLDGMKFSS